MSKIFSYLKEEREAHEEAEAAKALQAKLREEAIMRAEELRRQAIKKGIAKYEKTVMGLLTELRDAAYPDQEIKRQENGWRIYKISSYRESYPRGGYSYRSHEQTTISVELEFDDDNQPSGFLCKRGEKAMRVGLTYDELEKALVKLHPTNQP